jgi:hypothetical protein
MKRLVVVIVIGTVAMAGTASVAAGRRRGCDQHAAYRKNHRVLVFRTASKQTDDAGNYLTYYYACSRPSGQPVAIAVDSPTHGEYLPNDVSRRFPSPAISLGRWSSAEGAITICARSTILAAPTVQSLGPA